MMLKVLCGICISALLSLEAEATMAFQVLPKSRWGMRLDAPDDYMQDMAGEMARFDNNYDYSFNKSPISKSSYDTSDLVGAIEDAQMQMDAFQEQAQKKAQHMVSPWQKDDNIRDMAAEWDALGTNYDYSFNNSPMETQAQKMVQKKQYQISEATAQQEAKPLANPVEPVSAWLEDDNIRDTAAEWDALGTNYDYSCNNSPTYARCKESELRIAMKKSHLQAVQAAAQKETEPLVNPWARDHCDQWMTLSADRGERDLEVKPASPKQLQETAPFLEVNNALPEEQPRADGSYLESLTPVEQPRAGGSYLDSL